MTEDKLSAKLSLIANLLALQLTKDLNKEDAAWLLKQAGAENKNIAEILDITPKAVAAHHSNRLKKSKSRPAKGPQNSAEDRNDE